MAFRDRLKLIAATIAGLLGAASPAAAGRYVFTAITSPGWTGGGEAQAINDRDQVVGIFFPSTGTGSFTWSRGITTTVQGGAYQFGGLNDRGIAGGALQNSASGLNDTAALYDLKNQTAYPVNIDSKLGINVNGINASGTIVGTGVYEHKRKYYFIGFLSSGHKPTLLQVPGAVSTFGAAINDSGLVAGSYVDSANERQPGFTYQNGTYTTFTVPGEIGLSVNAVSASGAIGGGYVDAHGVHYGFVLNGSTVTTYDFPGSISTDVRGFGPNGLVFGNYTDQNYRYGGFIFLGGTYYDIRAPLAEQTVLSGMNASGSLIGYAYGAAGMPQAFIATCAAKHAPCTR